jgi:hypothetical protein
MNKYFFLNDARELRVISLRRRKMGLQGRGQRPILNPPPECYKGRVERPIPKSHITPKLKEKTSKPANTHDPTQLNTREEDSNLLRPRAPAEHQRPHSSLTFWSTNSIQGLPPSKTQ